MAEPVRLAEIYGESYWPSGSWTQAPDMELVELVQVDFVVSA